MIDQLKVSCAGSFFTKNSHRLNGTELGDKIHFVVKGERRLERAKRTKLFIEVGEQEAIQCANEIIEKYEVEVVMPPTVGLTMIKMRESAKNSLFYIGEVLVTESRVKIGNSFGIGIVMKEKKELSRALAVIDAAYKEQLPETGDWKKILLQLEREWNTKLDQMKCSIERTKVNFETMTI